MGAVLNGGLALGWVCRALGADWQQLYAAAAMAPRPDDPFFLPHLHGERTPYLDPALRGAWTGLSPRHDRRQLLRAALEGVAFAIGDALEFVLAPGEKVAQLRLAGGGSTDPAWRQMLADILGCSLAPVEVPAASGLGAALLGARAAELTDRKTFASRTPGVPAVIAARDADRDLYSERRQAFRRRVQALRDIDNDTVGIAGSAQPSVARTLLSPIPKR
jgi:xylulokinase